jgi:hypothetical protein
VEELGSAEKGKKFIKDNIARDKHTIRRNMEALVAFMKRIVPKEHTLFRPKFKFMIVVWTSMRPTRTPKNFEKRVVGSFMKQEL